MTRARGKTANLQLVKENNLTLLFNLVYHQNPVSRAELAAQTRLSPTTVSSLIEELRQSGLVRETGVGRTASSGRKPVLLEIQANGAWILAIEMTAGICRCALYNLLCQCIDILETPSVCAGSPADQLAELAGAMLNRHPDASGRLIGIAVGVPGLIDSDRNLVLASTVVPQTAGIDPAEALRALFPTVPVFLENESNLCAFAEFQSGGYDAAGSLVCLNINQGIGAGIIQDGRLYRGAWGLAGEAGHITIDRHGPRCLCGNRGCLEIMAAIPAMVQLAALPILTGRPTAIKTLAGGDLNLITASVISQAYRQGDALAGEIVHEIADRLASGINSIINICNPQAVVLSGEICRLGESFLDLLQACLTGMALPSGGHQVEIRMAAVQENAVLLGGAKIVLNEVFRQPAVFAGHSG